MDKLRILLLEDSPLDAELILGRLALEGLDCEPCRVHSRAAYLTALQESPFDLILADFALPGFDGRTALALAREKCPQVPFLFVSGAMGEEVAIEMLKGGATDYVLKDRLERLVPSMRRALREAAERVERLKLEETLRRRAEELAEAHRHKDQFLSILSHELRNPLAPLRNALHILRLHAPQDPTLGEVREIMERQVQQLTRLVDDLLDVSRIASGKVQLRKERVDLCAVAIQAVETARPLIDKRQHAISLALPSQPLWLEADPSRLDQVVTNLLNNAAKYTDPGGRIWLSVAREEEAVLRVRDSGIGIAAEMQPYIFDLYAQAERAREHSQGGLGIGLALVRALVELHGGSVRVSSGGIGQGSEFTVRLPALPESVQRPEEPVKVRPAAADVARRVLIVDDNRDSAESLAILLKVTGHDVRTAHNGPAALEGARSFQPEVVLLDIALPGMNGYEVADRLKGEPGLQEVILVAMTGFGQAEDRRRSEEAGFSAHLVKPLDLSTLRELLARTGRT